MNRHGIWAGICDRCNQPFLIAQFPHGALCPSCYLGAMPADERHRLLGYAKRTGVRVP
jgi:hypothetical protein